MRARKGEKGREKAGRVGCLVVLALGGLALDTASAEAQVMDSVGQIVPINGRRFHLLCAGTGAPMVVLEAGAGSTTRGWRLVLPEVARLTRVCAYDRSGLGRSQPGLESRDPLAIAEDLRTLLRAAGEGGPYVLVGHSNGGPYARIFADRFPDAVAGLVLVDPSDEHFYERAKPFMPESHWEGWTRSESATTVLLRIARAPDVPAVVLTSGQAGIHAAPGYQLDSLRVAWRAAHAKTARKLGARHQIVAESGHLIQLDRPEVVVTAIREVVEAARGRGH